jgi:hypothetical protein
VFLFLLRSLRGRAPLKNAAWAGAALGGSWLCGHHAPSLALTYAVAGVGASALFRRGTRLQIALRLAVLFGVMALVAAVQALPAAEYGKLAKRWTATGALTWNDKVEYPEHEDSGLRPTDLLHLVMPGGSGMRSDPFEGTVALSLAAIAVWSSFRRREVRMFLLLAIAALLCTLSRFDPLYGILYALGPLVEKSRAPIVILSVFHFALRCWWRWAPMRWLRAPPSLPRDFESAALVRRPHLRAVHADDVPEARGLQRDCGWRSAAGHDRAGGAAGRRAVSCLVPRPPEPPMGARACRAAANH